MNAAAVSQASSPILARPWIAFAAVAYLVVVVAIGLWALRRTRNARDFFIAGQGIGLTVTALATMSAAFSGFVFLGGPGLTYRIGVASLFIVAPVGFTAALLCWTLGKRLRLLAGAREIFTIPDAMAARFGGRAPAGLAAAAIVAGTVGYLGAQILALGRLIEAIFGTRALFGPWSLAAATAAGLVVVLFYSTAGGMLAGVYTDLFQGALMVAAASAVFVTALSAAAASAPSGRRSPAPTASAPPSSTPLARCRWSPRSAFSSSSAWASSASRRCSTSSSCSTTRASCAGCRWRWVAARSSAC